MKYHWYGEMIFEIKQIYHTKKPLPTGNADSRLTSLFEWQYYHWYGELKIHETHDKIHKQLRQQNITFHLVQVPSMV